MDSLIQPIFVNEDGEQSKDCTLIAFWKMIFSYLELPPEHQLQLRWLCHIFYDALPPIIWTSFSEHILTCVDQLWKILPTNRSRSQKTIFK